MLLQLYENRMNVPTYSKLVGLKEQPWALNLHKCINQHIGIGCSQKVDVPSINAHLSDRRLHGPQFFLLILPASSEVWDEDSQALEAPMLLPIGKNTRGYRSKPWYPGEPQNNRQTDFHM